MLAALEQALRRKATTSRRKSTSMEMAPSTDLHASTTGDARTRQRVALSREEEQRHRPGPVVPELAKATPPLLTAPMVAGKHELGERGCLDSAGDTAAKPCTSHHARWLHSPAPSSKEASTVSAGQRRCGFLMVPALRGRGASASRRLGLGSVGARGAALALALGLAELRLHPAQHGRSRWTGRRARRGNV